MVKSKTIKPEGQLLTIEEEQQPDIIEVSFTQAKKLAKKPMTEKQAEHVQKMVEMNRLKWEAQKKAKEEHYKKLQAQEDAKTKVLVKPKRIYPPRSSKKAPKRNEDLEQYSDDDTSSEESSEENETYQVSKAPPPTKKVVKKIEKRIDDVKKLVEAKPQPQSRYSGFMNKFWGA